VVPDRGYERFEQRCGAEDRAGAHDPPRAGSANNAGTFQPYDPSKIASDSPTMMAAPQAEWGMRVVGQIVGGGQSSGGVLRWRLYRC
jgi:hypothetical protein